MNSGHATPEPDASHGQLRLYIVGAVLGAILIHPIAFALAWLKGFITGASIPIAPTPTDRYGLDGASAGIAELFFVYISTLGLVPLLISLVGGGVSFALTHRFGKKSGIYNASTTQQAASSSPALLAAIWASSPVIGQTCIQYLVFLSLETFYWNDRRSVFFLLHLCIWTLGAAVAFGKHHDWRVAAGLIGFAVLLPALGWWLPRYVLLAVSIGVLLFCLSQRASRSSHQSAGGMPAALNTDQDALSGFALCVLGGVTFYTLVCLFFLAWALSLPVGSEEWGPGMVLILGVWGIPVFGGLALLARNQVGQWLKLTTGRIWITVAGELCVCALTWLYVVLHL